jgi:predicted transcriptional regulator
MPQKKVMHVMRPGAFTCTDETTLRDVAQIMTIHNIRYCVVVNDQHEILGVISARSILMGFGKDLEQTTARDILLPYTVTISPNTPLKDAVDLMIKKKIEHLIVIPDRPGAKAILGLLHAEDIVDKMLFGWRRQNEKVLRSDGESV